MDISLDIMKDNYFIFCINFLCGSFLTIKITYLISCHFQSCLHFFLDSYSKGNKCHQGSYHLKHFKCKIFQSKPSMTGFINKLYSLTCLHNGISVFLLPVALAGHLENNIFWSAEIHDGSAHGCMCSLLHRNEGVRLPNWWRCGFCN